MDSPSGLQTHLSLGGQELVVVEMGGGIRSYNVDGHPVLDGYSESEMCTDGRGQLLAPWPNRLEDGLFDWEGSRHQVPINEPEHHNAIHGLVRWSPWSVLELGSSHVRLAHTLLPQPGWPWRLDFEVTYRLDGNGLEISTSVTHVEVGAASGPCPFGVGWHPYLACFGGIVDQSVLRVPAGSAYRSDDRGLPVGSYYVTGTEVDFREAREVGALHLDTAFTDLIRGSDGRTNVEITPAGSAQLGTRLWMGPAFTHVMVYSGDSVSDARRRRRGLAVEPMTCPPNMLRTGEGALVLQPGETFDADWGLEAFSF